MEVKGKTKTDRNNRQGRDGRSGRWEAGVGVVLNRSIRSKAAREMCRMLPCFFCLRYGDRNAQLAGRVTGGYPSFLVNSSGGQLIKASTLSASFTRNTACSI